MSLSSLQSKSIKKKKKKAVSPLIATIVLISFTIAIGSLVINWGKQFITAQTQGLQQAGVECQKENMQIVSATWDRTNNKLKFITKNMGEIEFKFKTVNVYFDDGTVTTLPSAGNSISDGTNKCGGNGNNGKDCSVAVGEVKNWNVKLNNDANKKIQYIEIPSSKCTQNLYYFYNVQQ